MTDQGAPHIGSEGAVQESIEGSDDPHALRSELRGREAERQRLEQELGVALEDRKQLNRELEEARHLLLKLRRTLDAQEEALQASQQGLRRLQRSRSWRMTRPIRGFGGLTRRLLRRQDQRPQLPA
jgi:chromosome segregation ATPase